MRCLGLASSLVLAFLASGCLPSPGVPVDDTSSTGAGEDPSMGPTGSSSGAEVETTADPSGVDGTGTGSSGTSDTSDASGPSTSDTSTGDISTGDTGTSDVSTGDISTGSSDTSDASTGDTGTSDVSTGDPPGAPVLSLGFSAVKQFDFSWVAVADADHYQLEESAAPGEPFVPLGGDIVGTSISHTMPLHLRYEASYRLRACNVAGCTDSAVVDVTSSLADAIGYFKASNTGASDSFGWSVAISGDGNTLAVGARHESSNATGIDGDQANNDASSSGAVYVFVRDDLGGWTQQSYIKASNAQGGDLFGWSVALSEDGSTLAVGAHEEDSNATGIDGDQGNDDEWFSGAAYVFVRDGMGTWSQQAYVKASNTDGGDSFGWRVALSGDGDTLAVSALDEGSQATGIDGNQGNGPDFGYTGAVYVFVRDDMGAWSQQAYVKASNTGSQDHFGSSVALSWDGDTLAVGAYQEDSSATGIDGNQASNAASNSGAVYVFVRDGMGTWSQQAYVKASNTGTNDHFGQSTALSGDGNTLAVGASQESSNASGIDGDQANDAAVSSGAAYVFVRDGMGTWSQQAYVKASNTDGGDAFGQSVSLSADGNTLAVGAHGEDGNAVGLEGDPNDDSALAAGAAYVFVRDGMGTWSQQAYVKASNTGGSDNFGRNVALSGEGEVLVVSSDNEDGSATGIDGDQSSNAASNSGAVYLY